MCFLDMDIFSEHLVLFLNKEGSSSICSIDMPNLSNCKVSSLFLMHINDWLGCTVKFSVNVSKRNVLLF